MHTRAPFPLRHLAAAIPLTLALHAHANETSTQLATVEVTASTPTQDDTLQRQTLLDQQAQNLSDVFQSDAEINIGGGGNPIAQKMYIRSMEESLLNLSVDGAQINSKVYHHQTALILDPQLIKQVEVEKGTAAASAGPGALGGAIRYQTVSARDLLRPGQTIGGSVTGSVFSNDGWRSSANVYGQAGNLDALLAATTMRTDDYQAGNGQTIANSGTEQANYLAKVGLQLTPQQRLSASFQRSSDEGVRTARANMVGFAHPVLPNDPIPQSLARDTATLNYSGQQLGWIDAANATLYRSEVESERTNKKGRSWGESLTTQGADLMLKQALGEHLLKYGLNWREEKSAANRIANPYGLTGTGSESMRVWGGFVEGEANWASLTFTAGLRYDDYSYTDNHRQNYTSDGVSPSAGVRWQATDALQLRAGYAKSLRGVGLKEAFMLDIAQWKNLPKIEAESAHNTELGFSYQQGGLSLAGNVYRQIIDNYITTFSCANAKGGCRGNLGRATIDGYELSAQYQLRDWQFGLSVADGRPELDGRKFNDADLGLGTSTGRTWVSKVGYRLPAQRLELGWMGRYVEALDYLPVGGKAEQTKAGYGVHDLYLTWRPLAKDTLRLNLTVKNLLDKHYYDQATYAYNGWQGKVLGYPEPGRDVRLEASWQF
ncbi:TonB-dependent receptor domain-containing protein [Chitinibacter sp. ZOR0017]|uniref:TonB-dependent receptor domain-containing protein n=1 Tax=Chitinibacter sp. ZOR0017 TaxID=1339254 RepID=UPI0006471B1B|nr:TonB-dependent receptor [Chitinibacter sp. ZOR0017]